MRFWFTLAAVVALAGTATALPQKEKDKGKEAQKDAKGKDAKDQDEKGKEAQPGDKKKRNPVQVTAEARAVLKAHCYRCHSARSSTPHKFDVSDHKTLVNPVPLGTAKEQYVKPGDPKGSRLYRAVAGDENGANARMPQIGSQERTHFGPGQREIIREWIEIGAPAFALPGKDRAFISTKDTLKAVLAHVRKTDPADRKYMRYFTFTNLHNTPELSDEELAGYRAAFSKVLNSLTWASAIITPEVVDADTKTVLAVNLKELDWHRTNLWEAVFQAYPYGLKYTEYDEDAELRNLDRSIRQESEQSLTLTVIRGDWFISTASRPPLYHGLLYDRVMPELMKRQTGPNKANPKSMTAYDLEAYLGVDVFSNFRNGTLARAAFTQSGVSNQNRMIERHPNTKTGGAYWKSYDFLPNAGRGRFLRFPLGPQSFLSPNFRGESDHPYPELAFNHDGGEAIFVLPNGMQGYLLVNGKDERIDAGPIQVVSDNNRVSGTFEIVNGVSCMSCHAHGMIRPGTGDEIRGNAAAFGRASEKIERLHPTNAQMEKLYALDQKKFLNAAKQAVLPMLGEDPNMDDAVFMGYLDPVAAATIDYRLRFLDLKAVATELGFDDPNKFALKIGEQHFRELGLGNLLKPGGVISRDEWEATHEGRSLLQDLGFNLGYIPVGGPTKQ